MRLGQRHDFLMHSAILITVAMYGMEGCSLTNHEIAIVCHNYVKNMQGCSSTRPVQNRAFKFYLIDLKKYITIPANFDGVSKTTR